MGVQLSPLGYQPICNECGIALCWDISEIEYSEAEDFWDNWKCLTCNGKRMSLKEWKANNLHSNM